MEIPLGFQDIRSEPLSLPVISDYLNGVSAKLDDYTAQRTTLEDRIRDNTQDVKDLEKFLQLPSDLEEIYHLNYVRFRFGRMPRESYDSLAVKADQISELILYHAAGFRFCISCLCDPKRICSKNRQSALLSGL
jgi:V/A-type H+-transporting ATPase subunit I